MAAAVVPAQRQALNRPTGLAHIEQRLVGVRDLFVVLVIGIFGLGEEVRRRKLLLITATIRASPR